MLVVRVYELTDLTCFAIGFCFWVMSSLGVGGTAVCGRCVGGEDAKMTGGLRTPPQPAQSAPGLCTPGNPYRTVFLVASRLLSALCNLE